jgi:hypothetical protein
MELTQKLREPFWLVVVLYGDGAGVEKDEYDDKPVEPLLLDHPPDLKTDLLLVDPKVRVLFELFLQHETGNLLFLE